MRHIIILNRPLKVKTCILDHEEREDREKDAGRGGRGSGVLIRTKEVGRGSLITAGDQGGKK